MSKLLRLKEWFTLEDAARYLSVAMREEVSVADILQLAVEGQLVLSVNLVNHARAKRGVIKTAAEAGTIKVPLPSLRKQDEVMHELPCGIPLTDGNVLVIEDEVRTLAGVWDLPMIGGERIALEKMLMRLVEGPRPDFVSIDGSFLQRHGDPLEVWSVQAIGTRRKLNPEWERRKENGEDVSGVIPHLEETETFYYPAGGLPDDSQLVASTLNLQEFLNDLNGASQEKPLSTREENSQLAIIGALLELMLEENGKGKTRSGFNDQAAIIDGVMARFENVPGLKKRNLEDKFAKARQILRR